LAIIKDKTGAGIDRSFGTVKQHDTVCSRGVEDGFGIDRIPIDKREILQFLSGQLQFRTFFRSPGLVQYDIDITHDRIHHPALEASQFLAVSVAWQRNSYG